MTSHSFNKPSPSSKSALTVGLTAKLNAAAASRRSLSLGSNDSGSTGSNLPKAVFCEMEVEIKTDYFPSQNSTPLPSPSSRDSSGVSSRGSLGNSSPLNSKMRGPFFKPIDQLCPQANSSLALPRSVSATSIDSTSSSESAPIKIKGDGRLSRCSSTDESKNTNNALFLKVDFENFIRTIQPAIDFVHALRNFYSQYEGSKNEDIKFFILNYFLENRASEHVITNETFVKIINSYDDDYDGLINFILALDDNLDTELTPEKLFDHTSLAENKNPKKATFITTSFLAKFFEDCKCKASERLWSKN